MARLQQVYGDDVDTLIADRRYGFINGVVREAVGRPATQPLTLSDRIDRIVTNRWLGIPIFMLAMWFVFQMTANVSGYYMDWLDGVISGPIAHWIDALVVALGLGGTWVEALMLDGVVAGVGGVLVFVPLLLFLYFFLAILEDSGYMARAAFVMDRLMHALGLHGKSFLPMLVGFGCSVPGIYATRTLENEEDRRLTGLLVPMMSCGARLPVYAVFGAAFFPAHTGRFIFGLYLIGIVLAVVSGLVFKRLLFRNKPPAPFVMELPPYRVPSLRGVLTHMWERSASCVRRAGTIILGAAVVLWLLMNLPWGVESPRESVFGQISNAISPIFAPAGFDRWEATGSLVTGLIAKRWWWAP
jgi:ferrous iron transport protein B